ncbi:hypothetical protein IFM89_003565 [Coptis chinensis]|uniref:Uncharacterized protein n=1 Tax=Coptis chinensis TaxID=261450 RepID=A0A835HY69_9MAGN|nr:hypothetical protein IFM89_003565 [Coptis chinensis]
MLTVSPTLFCALPSGDRFVVKVRISGSSPLGYSLNMRFSSYQIKSPFSEAKAIAICLDKNYRPVCIPPELQSKVVQYLRNEGLM